MAGAPDTAITFNEATRQFDVDYQFRVEPITQVQTVTVKVISVSNYSAISGQNQREEQITFTVSFIDPCDDIGIVSLINPGQTDPEPFDYI